MAVSNNLNSCLCNICIMLRVICLAGHLRKKYYDGRLVGREIVQLKISSTWIIQWTLIEKLEGLSDVGYI
jgi:hypothetical protein